MSDLIHEQTPPQPSAGDCWLLVMEDMKARREMGIAKYGVPVQPFNGRKPLVDLFQELLDAVVYARQEIEERAIAVAPLLQLEKCVLEESQYQHWRLTRSGTDALIQVLEWIRKIKRGETLPTES